ncbi:hypothetical protein [Pantanalinema sp. GBBB05]|uniref:hypothetical protein n=1 Tax=Pantanalinema sp. GBBB05 TaxID=2604139 RepID=UPI001DF3F7C7|nr:hypothetical protein [Pantanalinema sp. GBBB05]
MEQLNFLDWQPPPEQMQEPEIQPKPVQPPGNPHLINWWQAKVNYYRQLQIQFADRAFQSAQAGQPDRLQPMRKHEISRLQALINEAIAKVTQLGETP